MDVSLLLMQQINQLQRSKNYLITFFRSLTWKNSAEEASNFVGGGKLPCLLIENKCDLLEEAEQDNVAALKEFSDKNGYVGCFRASAKTGKNIDESMDFLIKTIVEKMEGATDQGKQVFTTERKNVVLDKQPHASPAKEKKKQQNCC